MPIQWLSVKEAAETLGVSEPTVRRRANRNMLPSKRGPRNRLIVGVPGDETPAPAHHATAQQTEPDQNDRAHHNNHAACNGHASAPASHPHRLHTNGTATATRPAPEQASRAHELPTRRGGFSAASSPAQSLALGPELARPYARLQPGALLGQPTTRDGQTQDESDLQRYQRLAGASLVLAQRQADEAREHLGRVNAEARRLRQLCIAGWSSAGAVALLSMLIFAIT